MTSLVNYLRIVLLFGDDIKSLRRYSSLHGYKKYAFFQKYYYNKHAKTADYKSDIKDDRKIVGSYESHNEWNDYDQYLFKDLDKSYRKKIALDFGTGPCRNIIQYSGFFKRLDGVDISEELIKKGIENLKFHKISVPKLYVNNGYDLSVIKDGAYDFVFSTITMQHICVYKIRFNLLEEMYRILRKNGRIAIQMGYGKKSPKSVDYYENNYLALATNRGCDARIESISEVSKDLEAIGYRDFSYDLRPTGPGDVHPKWIFFRAKK